MAALAPVSVDSQIVNNGIKAVVYGGSGVGKTRLALTAPRPIILSAERGILSLRGNNLPMLPEIRTLAELVNAHNWCCNDAGAQRFDTIMVDSITEIAEVVLRASHANTKDGRKAHNDTNELIINTVFRAFRDLPRKHVIMIAKERRDEDQFTKIMQATPDMPNGKLRTALPHYFDFVFRYIDTVGQDGQPWNGLQTKGNAHGIAKDRSGRLSPYEPPHLGNLFAKAMQ